MSYAQNVTKIMGSWDIMSETRMLPLSLNMNDQITLLVTFYVGSILPLIFIIF
jgi:hypothetical protein